MKKWRKYLQIIAASAVFVSVGGIWLLQNASAATGTIYLTPSSQSIQNGSSFTLNLRVNPGTSIDTVTANVAFDASKLSLTGLSCSGSPLTPISCASGNPAAITSYILAPSSVSTDSFVASLTFKALVGSGSSAITVSGDTATGGNPNGAGTAGTTVSFTTPTAPTCPAGQTGTYPNCTTPSTSGGGTTKTPPKTTTTTPTPTSTTPTTTPVANADGTATVADQDIQFTQATFSVTTKIPAQVYCQFGTDSSALTQQTAPDAFGTTHKVVFDPSTLTPGQTYYYVVVSKDQKGNVTQSTMNSFTTKGLTITVGVFDKNHKPVKNKTVTLHSTPATTKTDANGVATFSNVTPGDHHVIYAVGSKSYDQQISIANNVKTEAATQSAAVQNVSVVYSFTQSSSIVGRMVIVALLVVVVGVAIFAFTRRKVRFAAPAGAPLTVDPIVVGGNHSAPNFQDGSMPPSQETTERLNNIPEPYKPEPGSSVAPHDHDNNNDGTGL